MLLIYGITIDRKTLNSEAPSICPASIISEGIALIPAEKTTAANPVNIQIIITIRSIVFTGRFIKILLTKPSGFKLSVKGKFVISLCCNQPIGLRQFGSSKPLKTPSITLLFMHCVPRRSTETLIPLIIPICVSGGGRYS